MTELGKIEKPEASSFKSKRKLYVVPTLPFEELSLQFNLDTAKVERFWGEVREKIEYFVSNYGKIEAVFVEGVNDDEKAGLESFEKYGKESNHFKLIKNLVDSGAKLRGIDKREHIERSKLLFEEYSKSFLPMVKEIHQGFYGKEIDFEGWREYLVKKIQEAQEEMSSFASKIMGEMPDDSSGIVIITDGRPVEFPEGTDVFQVRPPAFDEIERKVRELGVGMK